MSHAVKVSSKSPQTVIFLVDVSASMLKLLGQSRRITLAKNALMNIIEEMVRRCAVGTGNMIRPRFRVSILLYGHRVHDPLGGIRSIEQLIDDPFIKLISELTVLDSEMEGTTNAHAAFIEAERLLHSEMSHIQANPAPLVVNISDGELDWGRGELEEVAQRIRYMTVADGNVLIENVLCSEEILREPIVDPTKWRGIRPETRIFGDDGIKMRNLCSRYPLTYRDYILEGTEINLYEDALMLAPVTLQELVRRTLQMVMTPKNCTS